IDTLIKLVAASIHADDPARNFERLQEAEALVDALPASADDASGQRQRAAWVQNWLGRVHYLRGNPEAAFDAYRKALELAQGLGNRELLSYPSCMIGRVLFMQGQFGRALPLLTQAVDGLDRTTDWREWGTALGLRLVVLAAQGAYADSL